MATSVDGVGANPLGNQDQQPGPRPITGDQAVYQAKADAGNSGGAEGADGGTAGEAVQKFIASMAIGELQRGLANSKRMQDESHSALKEAQNEDN